ncbi:MAG: sulfatase [Kiritimatiellales bacterium]
MKRRDFIGTAGAAAALPILSRSAGRKAVRRPNILFVFADQLRSMELGCYGGKQVRTPNIDRLAKEGVRFSHAISTYPVCSPFRGMLMTGNFPMKNGMVMNDHFMRNPSPYFAEVCRANGYQTGYIGKWHIDGRGRQAHIPPERRRGFDFWRTLECTHDYFNSNYYFQDETTMRKWEGYDAVSQTDCACEFIQQNAGADPFCLFLAWGPPHDPYIAPPEYIKRFPRERIQLRKNVDDFNAAEKMWSESDTLLPESYQATRNAFMTNLRDKSNAAIKTWYQGYYASIEVLDDCMGRLLDTLQQTGLLDDTIIVFTSDHGDILGSHRQYGKTLPYEESIRIPFIVRYPEKIKPATRTDALLAPVDMMPTLLSLAGLDCPPVDGKDISRAMQGREEELQDAVLIMRMVWLSTNWITNGSGPWRGVRTKQYTYARRSDTGAPWMLFDNEKDPQQLQNLINTPAYAGLVKQLDAKTDELLKAAGDPEDPVKIANLIWQERAQMKMPISRDVLFPEKIPAGSGFYS